MGYTKAYPLSFRGFIFLKHMGTDGAKKRVIVYVDGFNFYYGLKNPKWKKYYWLDIVKLFESFIRPDQELVSVKYFSAIPIGANKAKRQNAFFQANRENPKFELILGKYLAKKITCNNCNTDINSYEEKESDVRFATQIVADAFQKKCDISIIVSADSDMIPAFELVSGTKHHVYIYFPPNQYSNSLSKIGNKPVLMQQYEKRFKKALLPETIELKKDSYKLSIPAQWKQ